MSFRVSKTILPDEEDLFSEILFAAGAESISCEIKNNQFIISAIFSKDPINTEYLKSQGFQLIPFNEEDWKYQWLEFYQGFALTDSIYIHPLNSKQNAPDNYQNIIILDAKDAFGDGRHPTTRQCAEHLSQLLTGYSKKQTGQIEFLDIGTGTGILAIIAGILGTKNITAIDIEKESVKKTQQNAQLNQIKFKKIIQSDISQFTSPLKFEIICANLLTTIVKHNISSIKILLAQKGHLIISGISQEWQSQMIELFQQHQFTILNSSIQDNWCCFHLTH
ncbi:MAG: 50S ribosomal protein L11 methyltransferase [Spirochaetes bacterium]|nr:50S ribosomal protein L11 methyltransferase [Spirochaetota bacterium]